MAIACLAVIALVGGCSTSGDAGAQGEPAAADSGSAQPSAVAEAPGQTGEPSPRSTQPSPSDPPAATSGGEQPAPSPSPRAADDLALLDALRQGGNVIFIRHAATETFTEDETVDLADRSTQRNLSEEGRRQAIAIGEAFDELGIPVGRVVSGPYARARDTAELAFGADAVVVDEALLYQDHPDADRSELAQDLRARLTTAPPPGTNVVLVGHGDPLMGAARVTVQEGDAAVFRPDGTSEPALLEIVPADGWTALDG